MATKRKSSKRSPKAVDAMQFGAQPDDLHETSKLHLKTCKFWKSGRCNWGWGCRFLHGDFLNEDPRRPEYRGKPIDFTKFPRPFNANSPPHSHFEKRPPLRAPVVEIGISDISLEKVGFAIKDQLLRGSINVLQTQINNKFNVITHDLVNEKLSSNGADFFIFIDTNAFILFPGNANVQQHSICEWIRHKWNSKNNNLSPDEIELLTLDNLEEKIKQISGPQTGLDDIASKISSFQDQVNVINASQEFQESQIPQQNIMKLRLDLANFFGKLNLANSIIADYQLFGNSFNNSRGEIVSSIPPKPIGISTPLQKALIYMVGQFLTQIHVCLYYINKILGEDNNNPSLYSIVSSASQCMHPSPYCFADFGSISNDDVKNQEDIMPNTTIGVIEMDVSVNNMMQYNVSFRNGADPMFNQAPFK